MSKVHARPVARYGWPDYPTRLAALGRPELLSRRRPAWGQGAGWASAAAVAVGTELVGCQEPRDGRSIAASQERILVAPVFVHGEGRGSTGCVVVSPPVFLSEEDALQTIREELCFAGVAVTWATLTLQDVSIPQVSQSWRPGDGSLLLIDRPDRVPLVLDFVDASGRIAVEFASREDSDSIAGPWVNEGSSVTDYRMPEVAAFLRAKAGNSSQPVYCGFFYDPLVSRDNYYEWAFGKLMELPAEERKTASPDQWRDEWQQFQNQEFDRTRDLLRLQVKDFIDWLKGQGAI